MGRSNTPEPVDFERLKNTDFGAARSDARADFESASHALCSKPLIRPADKTAKVLQDVAAEREHQNAKFPDQELPDGTSQWRYRGDADRARRICDSAAEDGLLWWSHILTEEFYEALAEEDTGKLREELIHVAAVAVRWIEDIDRRTRGE